MNRHFSLLTAGSSNNPVIWSTVGLQRKTSVYSLLSFSQQRKINVYLPVVKLIPRLHWQTDTQLAFSIFLMGKLLREREGGIDWGWFGYTDVSRKPCQKLETQLFVHWIGFRWDCSLLNVFCFKCPSLDKPFWINTIVSFDMNCHHHVASIASDFCLATRWKNWNRSDWCRVSGSQVPQPTLHSGLGDGTPPEGIIFFGGL